MRTLLAGAIACLQAPAAAGYAPGGRLAARPASARASQQGERDAPFGFGPLRSTAAPLAPEEKRAPFGFRWPRRRRSGSVVPAFDEDSAAALSVPVAINGGDPWCGWRVNDDELRALVAEATSTERSVPVMRQFHPRRSWLWAQWHGTIVKSVLRNEVRLIVAWSLVLMVAVACSYTAAPSGGRALLRMSEAARSAAPAPGGGGAAGVAASLHSMLSFKGFLVAGPRAPAATAAEQAVAATLAALKPIERFWAIAQTLVAFVLSFFLQQTYTVWRTVYSISRRVQGRLSDVGLLLAVNAERDAAGNVTPRAQEVLDTAGRYCRLFNVLFFASVTRQYAPFATPKGLRALQAAGVIRQDELDVLIETSSWHQTVAAWLGTLTARAVGDGRIGGGGALYFQLSGVLALLRAQYAQMADELSGRMPLAYTHFVQVLVDSLCLAAPLALVGQLGLVGAVVATAFVTLFYAGILDLAKMFLDPFDNEDYGGRSGIRIEAHTLVQEVNSLTFRWAKCAQKLPRGVLEALPTLETPPEPLSDDSRLAGDEPRRSDDAVEGYGATSAAYVAYGSLPLDEDSDDTGGAGAPLCTSGDVIIPFADAADDEAQPPRTFNVEAVV